jgi:hypothetical protein
MFKKFETLGLLLLVLIAIADAYFWYLIIVKTPDTTTSRLNNLITLNGGFKIVIDGEATGTVVSDAHYIDIGIVGNANTNSWIGFRTLLTKYSFGAFIYNGRDAGTSAWRSFVGELKARRIPLITVGAGDSIRYANNRIDFLSPNREFAESPDQREAGLVELIQTPTASTTIMTDVSQNVRDLLLYNKGK